MKSKVIRLNEDQIKIIAKLIQKEIDRQIYYDYDEIQIKLYTTLLKKIIMKM